MKRRGLGVMALSAVLTATPGTGPGAAETGPTGGKFDEAGVRAAVSRFLGAFENLDWEAFRSCFDDDATVFFPSPEPPERHEGRGSVEARFRKVFEAIRASAPPGPPYHRLEAKDLRVDPLGPEAALVTFHLVNAERWARRTIVYRAVGGRWRIVHLHASNAPVP